MRNIPAPPLVFFPNFLQCDHTVALKSFFDMILNEPTKLAIVGGGCSVATEPVAEISHYYNITQVGDTQTQYNKSHFVA